MGFVWQAGGACITRFLASTDTKFPVYFQRSVFILGDRGEGGGCGSLKARPLPLPECEMLCLRDAGLLLLIQPVCCSLRVLVGRVYGAICRGQVAYMLGKAISFL